MQRTSIQYLTHSWNPITMKCTPVSAGCANCWAIQRAKMLAGNPNIVPEFRNAYAGAIPPVLGHTELEAPLHLKKPARIGVQFMGDLFHESIPKEWVVSIWMTMLSADRHRYFILTKRPQRMLGLTSVMYRDLVTGRPATETANHIWLGVSVSTDDDLWMVKTLLQIPAAHRWVSVEPMLGSVDLSGWLFIDEKGDSIEPPIHWVVLGGETGHKARPLHPDWVRSVKDQCQAAGVPFFFKSWGEWAPLGPTKAKQMVRVGHKHSGCLLDGQEWKEMPCTD